MTTLRPYQLDAIDRTRAAMRQHRRVVLQVPTGGGKTCIASEIVRRVIAGNHPVLWLAHRAELVDQAVATLKRYGVDAGALSASATSLPNAWAPVQVATIQTLLARNLRPRADLLVIDECHHSVADEYAALVHDYAESLVLGLTATPERSDGRGLSAQYGALVVGASVGQLIAEGHLRPWEVLRPGRHLNPGEIAQSPVDAYLQHAQGRQTIVFARSVELAWDYALAFRDHGVKAWLVSADTIASERADTIDRFRRGELRVLVNVNVLTEGFDAPSTSCVILARGCSTAGAYLQMTGRARAVGAENALLLDLRGVSHEFGKPDDEREFSLDGRGIRRKDDVVYCPVCGGIREPGDGCTSCGWQPETAEQKRDRILNEQLVKFAHKRVEDDEKRFETLVRWMREGRAKGYKPRFIFGKWRAVYGVPLTTAEFQRAVAELARKGAA